jgi:hypothetical protein
VALRRAAAFVGLQPVIHRGRRNMVNSSDIERFVRGTLGCGCPDEVFHSISMRQIEPDTLRSAYIELLIGSRLLIQIFEVPRDPSAGDWLERAVADGRAARDRHGYHRYRLVLVAPAAARSTVDHAGLDARFARSSTGDERAHLHLLTLDQLPASLRPPAARPPVGSAAETPAGATGVK